MQDKFHHFADAILGMRTNNDLLVRKTVIALMPTLAIYDTRTFLEHFLHKCIAHLLKQLSKPNERPNGEPWYESS